MSVNLFINIVLIYTITHLIQVISLGKFTNLFDKTLVFYFFSHKTHDTPQHGSRHQEG